jgi:hypothetical protein
MKNNLISESEKKEILLMHKSLMKEQVTKSSTNSDRDILEKSKASGCLKNGKILTNNDQTIFVYRATTESGKEVDFYADMTYKFRDGSKSGKWGCPQLNTAQQDDKQNTPKTLNPNQLKVLELIKPFRWVTSPVPTDVEIDNGAFLKMDLSKTDGGEFTNLSTEDKALSEKYSKYFQTDYPNGFFVYKKVAAQTPTQIGKGSKVEVTIESCKTSIESLYNNMDSPRTYPLAAEDKTNHKIITKTCIEPANKGKFTIRFGLNSKVKKLKEAGVI